MPFPEEENGLTKFQMLSSLVNRCPRFRHNNRGTFFYFAQSTHKYATSFTFNHLPHWLLFRSTAGGWTKKRKATISFREASKTDIQVGDKEFWKIRKYLGRLLCKTKSVLDGIFHIFSNFGERLRKLGITEDSEDFPFAEELPFQVQEWMPVSDFIQYYW